MEKELTEDKIASSLLMKSPGMLWKAFGWSLKYGKRGYLAFILVGGICGGICGGFSSAIFSVVKNNIFIISLSIISILIFAISSYFELITLKKYEIK